VGLTKPRLDSPQLRQAFDAIIERLEVLDGIRGDELDKAVTWRELSDSGFTIENLGSGGSPVVTNTPGPGDGTPSPDTTGPAAAPTNLTASETWLAILLNWGNPPANLQFVEIWRNTEDDLTLTSPTMQRIGTSRAGMYLDYVGAEASYYYWIRSVGTDGSYSAFYDPFPSTAIVEGVPGTTGVDPSDWEDNVNWSANALDDLLNSRIDLIDDPTTGLVDRVNVAYEDIDAVEQRTDALEAQYTYITGSDPGQLDLANFISAQSEYNTTTTTAVGQVSGELSDLVDFVGDTNGLPAGWGNTVVDALQTSSASIDSLSSSIGALDSEGGEEWDFTNTADGWTASDITLSIQTTAILLTQDGADPQFISPTISLTGGIFTQVVARVRQTTSGGGWEGAAYYKTAAHGFSNSYKKVISDPNLPLGTWRTLTWDMTDLTAGGDDWQNNTITQIRLELGSGSGGVYEIDWVIIAKFSVTAQAEALDALTTRVVYVEGSGGLDMVGAQSTRLTTLESSITGKADASALSALTTDVLEIYDADAGTGLVVSNAQDITALTAQIDDENTGLNASAQAINELEADVTEIYNADTGEGIITAQASEITQLAVSLTGGFSSMVNAFTRAGEAYGSTFADSDVQAYNDLGNLDGVAALIATAGNVQKYIYRSDGDRLFVEPHGIYEIKFRVYHGRQNDQGSFYFGLNAYLNATTGTKTTVDVIRDKTVTSTTNNNPYWFSVRNAVGDDEWLDVTCYLLGDSVDPSRCPDMLVNGATSFTGASIFNDGHRTQSTGQYVEFRVLNYNTSPTYGDGQLTTVYFTNFTVQRIDAAAEFQAVIQEETSVLTNSIGDINATYAVRAELTTDPDGVSAPYVFGFGLMGDVINGTATSAFGIRADKFFVTNPGQPTDSAFPFVVDVVDGSATVGIRGELIVDGSIRGNSIFAKTIGAGKINVTTLDTVAADMGIIGAGLLTTSVITDGYYDPPDNLIPRYATDTSAWRVEIEGGSAWPLWFGINGKDDGGLFYVTDSGDVVVKGILRASVIEQSFFAPANINNSFRIACEYPNEFTPGNYSGTRAHINVLQHVNFYSDSNFGTSIFSGGTYFEWTSDAIGFDGPFRDTTEEYARLGTYSEMILIDIGCQIEIAGEAVGAAKTHAMYLQYQYDSEGWKDAFYIPLRITRTSGSSSVNHVSAFHSQHFVSRSTAFERLQFRLSADAAPNATSSSQVAVVSASLKASTPNFGYADASVGDLTGTAPRIDQLPQHAQWT
jgi:hypothetical protein